MAARIQTVAYNGIDVIPIEVQVSLTLGLPAFNIVGLADKAVSESKERVRSALSAIGLALPAKRITVNLAPADLNKEGSHYDLAIATSILVAMDVLDAEELLNFIVMGELALDGHLSSIHGVLPASVHALSQNMGLICPAQQGSEALWAGDVDVLAPRTLLELISHFKGKHLLNKPIRANLQKHKNSPPEIDMQEIKGQETAKRALEICAAGQHNLLMCGPPGAGKSMLAKALSGILPPLDAREALEVSMIHSLGSHLPKEGIITERPFRSPHHSATMPALIGGGKTAKPGEMSLAHLGVLFLDELPEFNRQTLEALRQPLESGYVHIARANAHVSYPARIQLIAAMNPCRCGYLGDGERACNRAPKCGRQYRDKISGPLLDRMDIYLEISALAPYELHSYSTTETSAIIKERVLNARLRQRERLHPYQMRTNSEVDGNLLFEIAHPCPSGQRLLEEAAKKLRLSARGYHRVLRVARTIADLEDCPKVREEHIAESLSYRERLN